jgi:hypothetical protein
MKTERILRAEEGRTTQSPQGFGARARGALVLRHFGKGKRPESGRRLPQSKTQAQEARLVVPAVLADRSAAHFLPSLGVLVVNPGPAGPFKVSQAHSRLATFHVVSRSWPFKGFQRDSKRFKPIQRYWKKIIYFYEQHPPLRMASQAGSSPGQGESSQVKLSQAVWWGKKIVYFLEGTAHSEQTHVARTLPWPMPAAARVPRRPKPFQGFFQKKKDYLYSDDNLRHLPFVRSKKGR